MARKKQTKTPEQRLKEALVPAEEQPYDVPENWCWVQVGAINEYVSKSVNPADDPQREYELYSVPIFETGTPEIVKGRDIGSTKQVVTKGDVLLCKINPRINRAWQVYGKTDLTSIASSEWIVVRARCFLPSFLVLVFTAAEFRKQLLSHVSGVGGSLMRAQPKYVKGYAIPLPPLAEQRRIVERVEGLFAKLDEVSRVLSEMIGSSEERRSSMLRSAFNGDLTARWRAERGIGLDSWERTTIGKCCCVGSGGTPSRKNPANYVGVIPWVKTGEINWNCIVATEEHISQDALETSSAKLYQPGAVLVAMYGMGQTRGKAALLEIPAATNQAVCVLEPDARLDRRYLYYFFMRNYWDIREQSIGGNQLNLSGTIIKQYEICLPSIEEQRAIADFLESALGKEALATAAAVECLENIQAIMQRILSDAMRGRLDTNGLNDSSAKEQLLEMWESQSVN